MARLYKKNFISSQASDPYEFCDKMFAGWDFAIREKHAKTNTNAISTQLTLLLKKKDSDIRKKNETKFLKVMIILLNIALWILSLGVIVGLGFATNIVAENTTNDDFWHIMALAGFATLLVFFVPYFFKFFVYLARWFKSEKKYLKLYLARAYLR